LIIAFGILNFVADLKKRAKSFSKKKITFLNIFNKWLDLDDFTESFDCRLAEIQAIKD
jgi:hypothetical protein